MKSRLRFPATRPHFPGGVPNKGEFTPVDLPRLAPFEARGAQSAGCAHRHARPRGRGIWTRAGGRLSPSFTPPNTPARAAAVRRELSRHRYTPTRRPGPRPTFSVEVSPGTASSPASINLRLGLSSRRLVLCVPSPRPQSSRRELQARPHSWRDDLCIQLAPGNPSPPPDSLASRWETTTLPTSQLRTKRLTTETPSGSVRCRRGHVSSG